MVSLVCGLSCNQGGVLVSKKEGVIIYDVSFPYAQNSLMIELYPKEMVLEFKGDLFHSTMKSSYGVVSTEFIIDNSDKTFIQLLKSFNDKYCMKLNEDETVEWLGQYPGVIITPTAETDTIAGYLCHKSIAYFVTDSIPPIELYTTKELKISESNWWNQFSKIDGFLMGYEFEQYGKRMKLRAREVRFEVVEADRFDVPVNYKPVGIIGMKHQIETLLTEFLK